jgi:hypothetical protein
VLLFWLALVPWAIAQRRWRILAGAALAILAATAIGLAANPQVLRQYVDVMTHRPPDSFRTPTIGTLLREAWGAGPFWLQYLSLIPGVLWLAIYVWRHRRHWDWGQELPLLLLVSVLLAPYGAWPFDLVLLLVAVLRVAAAAPSRIALWLYVGINGTAALMVARFIHFFWFLWLTPALLLSYLGLQHVTAQD